jgi:RNA polymerase sigma factor (sigma-70 family)
MPEDLFPEIQLYNKVEDNTVVQRIDADGFEMLASASRMAGLPPDRVVEIDSGKKALEGLLLSLTPKQERLIRKRFGLGAEREHTLEEIAEDFGVTRERIRQMEKKAFESLKFRASKLLEWRAVKDLHHTLMEIHNGQENTAR